MGLSAVTPAGDALAVAGRETFREARVVLRQEGGRRRGPVLVTEHDLRVPPAAGLLSASISVSAPAPSCSGAPRYQPNGIERGSERQFGLGRLQADAGFRHCASPRKGAGRGVCRVRQCMIIPVIVDTPLAGGCTPCAKPDPPSSRRPECRRIAAPAAALALETRRAYHAALGRHEEALAGRALTDATLAGHVATLTADGLAPASIAQAIAAACFLARVAGWPNPRGSMTGAARVRFSCGGGNNHGHSGVIVSLYAAIVTAVVS